MNVELDFKKSYVLEYLREQVSDIKPENGVFEFEVSQKDFEYYKARPQYGEPGLRDINKQLSSGNELGTILSLLSEETHGEFTLQSVVPKKQSDTFVAERMPDIEKMIKKSMIDVGKQLGTYDPKEKYEAPEFYSSPQITHWGSEYSVWTIEYHPENTGKPRVIVSSKESFNFHITKDRELVQVLPDRRDRVLKLSKTQYLFLLELYQADHTYLLADTIANTIGSSTRYVRTLAFNIRKAFDKKFVGITGKEFIESDEGYRLARKVNLKER